MALHETTAAFLNEELRDLLRDDSVSPEAIASEMRDAGVDPFPVESLQTARRVMRTFSPEEVAALEALPERLRHFLFDEAVSARATGFLTNLAQCGHKSLVKDAKRAIHLLKTRGVAIEAPRPTPVPAPAPAAVEELPTFMSSVDGTGERIVFLCSPARGGVDVAQVAISDEVGVVGAHLSALGRKDYKRFIQQLSQAKAGILGEIPRAYARSLIAAALDLNAKARKPVPVSFNDVTFMLGPAVPAQLSPGRALPSPADPAEVRQHGPSLLKLDIFKSWYPPQELMRPLFLKLDEIQVSPLYISEEQRAQSVRSVVSETTLRYWTTERRKLWAERLYDSAFLLRGANRVEASEWAYTTAAALESDLPTEAIPFCYAYFEQAALEVPPAEAPTPEPRERTSEGGIILPGP